MPVPVAVSICVVDNVSNVERNDVKIDDKESPVAVVPIVVVDKINLDLKGKDIVVNEEEFEAASVTSVVVNKVALGLISI